MSTPTYPTGPTPYPSEHDAPREPSEPSILHAVLRMTGSEITVPTTSVMVAEFLAEGWRIVNADDLLTILMSPYSIEEWQLDVAEGNTVVGYDEWRLAQHEAPVFDDDDTLPTPTAEQEAAMKRVLRAMPTVMPMLVTGNDDRIAAREVFDRTVGCLPGTDVNCSTPAVSYRRTPSGDFTGYVVSVAGVEIAVGVTKRTLDGAHIMAVDYAEEVGR